MAKKQIFYRHNPKSQGKVERLNQILKRQLAFDLIKHNREGINWVRKRPSYQNEINDRPKECLKWQTPFHVYFGRRRNCNDHHNIPVNDYGLDVVTTFFWTN